MTGEFGIILFPSSKTLCRTGWFEVFVFAASLMLQRRFRRSPGGGGNLSGNGDKSMLLALKLSARHLCSGNISLLVEEV